MKEVSDLIKKNRNQEFIINYLNNIEKIRYADNSQKSRSLDLFNLNKFNTNLNNGSESKIKNFSDNFIIKIIDSNLKSSYLDKNIIIPKLKIDQIEKNYSLEKKYDRKINKNKYKIKDFIQSLNTKSKRTGPETQDKKDINKSINIQEKNKIEFEVDSDYDLFLSIPQTDREQRDRIFPLIYEDAEEGRCNIRDLDEGNSQDFNEQIGIGNFYKSNYQSLENLYSERNII